jgi:hypothetical protein
METLWNDRRAPEPYRIDDLSSIPQSSAEFALNVVWDFEKWISEFASSIQVLAERFKQESKDERVLIWDKVCY